MSITHQDLTKTEEKLNITKIEWVYWLKIINLLFKLLNLFLLIVDLIPSNHSYLKY